MRPFALRTKSPTLLSGTSRTYIGNSGEAFRGELVPQDPNDEPVSVLLERIRKEREGLKKGIVVNGRHAKVSSEPVKIDVERTRQVELWEGVGG